VTICNGDDLLILDGGTGLRVLGDELMDSSFGRGKGKGTFLFTHLHWDHIQGFPFFKPAYIAGNSFKLYGPSHVDVTLEDAMRQQQQYQNFPFLMEDMPADITFTELPEGQVLQLNGMEITNHRLNHPGGVFAYRVSSEGKSIVYATDTEHFAALDPRLLSLAEGADLLIYDATYTSEEYKDHVSWGHSTWEEGVKMAKAARVKALHLFHHDPSHTDKMIDAIVRQARKVFPKTFAAKEGWVINV
jgi:phosphoribosyl 1,2-cyclic phosphodiesterase